jgi:hypothetical protein
MGIAQGYGKISGTDSLVLAIDTGETINSYIGEPTANLINPAGVNIYSWWTRSVQTIETLTETYKGHPIYRVSISIDSDDMLYHITQRWGAGSGWYMPYVTFNANIPYIASVIYRPISHPDTRIHGHPSNIGGWGATIDDSIDINAQWKLHRIDRNYGATVGDNRFYHMYTPSAQIGDTIVVDITNSQIEQNSHATPFVSGTRSSTQGLLPLIGSMTFPLNTVSFDSAAQIFFDGTDDRILIEGFTNKPTTEITCEAWIKPTKPSVGTGTIRGGAISSTNSMYLGIIDSTDGGNTFSMHWANQTTSSRVSNFNGQIPNNTWTHLVGTYDGATARAYLNGIEIWSAAQTGTIPDASYYIGTYGGVPVDGVHNFHGYIPVAKIYNRSLTATEVMNNYRHYKTRFGV